MSQYRQLQGHADELVVRAIRELQDQIYSLKGANTELQTKVSAIPIVAPEPPPTLLQQGLNLTLDAPVRISSGYGTPEGTVLGSIGDFYLRQRDGTPGAAVYVKETGQSTQTGWTSVATSGGGGLVTSIFTRTGAVVATSGDYTAAQVTNAAATNAANVFTLAQTLPTLYGGASANGDLTIEGTSHATKTTSYVILQPTGGNVGVGTTAPGTSSIVAATKILDVKGTSGYTNIRSYSTDSAGAAFFEMQNDLTRSFFLGTYGSTIAGTLFGVARANTTFLTAWSNLTMAMGTKSSLPVYVGTNDVVRLTIPGAGGLVVGIAALATNATNGFLYIPTCAGTPTGVPTAQTGTVAMVFDTTNNKLYIYDGGWLGGTAPGAFT